MEDEATSSPAKEVKKKNVSKASEKKKAKDAKRKAEKKEEREQARASQASNVQDRATSWVAPEHLKAEENQGEEVEVPVINPVVSEFRDMDLG